MAMWAQFAKTGNPSVKGLITVPAWEPGSDKYLYIADPLLINQDFDGFFHRRAVEPERAIFPAQLETAVIPKRHGQTIRHLAWDACYA